MKPIATNNGKKGGSLVGKSHAEGGIKAVVVDTQRPIEVESGEVIINKHAAKKYWKELSEINQSAGNGVPIEEPVFAKGGNFESTDKKEIYKKWKELVNMSYSELKDFYESKEGKEAGLTKNEAREQGIHSGRESAEWIMKMKKSPNSEWTLPMWEWAKRQISFVGRMSGMKGDLYDDKGNKTRKHTSLLIWGNNPEKYKNGGGIKTNCIDFINNSEPIKNNGYLHHFRSTAIYSNFGEKVPDVKNFYLITYNSGGQNNLKIIDTINTVELRNELQKHIGCTQAVAKIIVNEFISKAKRFNLDDLSKLHSENIIIADRDKIACTNIVSKFEKGGEILLAPNGKPTNLTAEQYRLVRTPQFKSWFGDWENDTENASKVVDENGEPLVVYRGIAENISHKYEFDFKTSLMTNYNRYNKFGFYFTDNELTAKIYAKGFAEQQLGIENETYLQKNEKFQYSNYEQYQEASKKYEVVLSYFLNIRNLLNLTPSNTNFPRYKDGQISSYLDSYKYRETLISLVELLNLLNIKEDFLNYYKGTSRYIEFNDLPLDHSYNIKKDVYSYFTEFKGNNTKSVKSLAQYLKNKILEKYDGIVFFEATNSPSSVYVTFKSNQIKLADGTNTTFDGSNPDIRFAKGGMTWDEYVKTQFNEDENRHLPSDYFEQFEIEEKNLEDYPNLLKSKNGLEYRKWKYGGIGVFDGNKIIAFADNGSIQVSPKYSKKGIGLELVSLLKEINPNHRFGNMTPQGWNLMRKYYNTKIANNPDIRYEQGGEITCSKCNWSWGKKDTKPKDAYVCHKCGYDNELKKGIKEEKEHIETAKDLYSHKITPNQAAKSIAEEHLSEDPEYYTKLLEKFENGGGIDETFSFKTPTGEPSRLTYLQQVLVRTKAFKNWFGDWEIAAKNFLKDNKENYDVHYKGISKVIDGITLEPKVVYHGTRTADEFYMFDVSKEKGVGRPYAYFAHNKEYSENFTTSSQRGHNNSKPFMYNCFLCIKNPFMAKGHEYSDKKRDAKSWIRTIVGTIVWDKYETIERNEKTKKFEVVVKEQIEKYLNEAIGNDKRPFWAFMARDKNSEFKMFLVSHGYDGIFYTEEYSSLYDVENPKEFTEAVTVFNPNDIKLADGRNLNFNPMQSDIRYETGGNLEEPIKEEPILSKKDRLGKLLFGEKYAVGGGINKENSIMPKTNETSENRIFVDNLIKKIHE